MLINGEEIYCDKENCPYKNCECCWATKKTYFAPIDSYRTGKGVSPNGYYSSGGIIQVKDKDGKVFDIPADSVIMSVGYNPAPVVPKSKHVHVIGDAAKVGNLRSVIWGAWDVCMKL